MSCPLDTPPSIPPALLRVRVNPVKPLSEPYPISSCTAEPVEIALPGRQWRLVPPTLAPRPFPARNGLPESCTSEPRQDRHDLASARLPACAWRDRPSPPEGPPASSSSPYFPTGWLLATLWSNHGARRKERVPYRAQSSCGHRVRSPVAVAKVRGPGTLVPPLARPAILTESRPEPRHETRPK